MWIFGYGSLIWKVDFPYEERVIGFVRNYKRRFWQASTDHRGTPLNPGRVVTLVPDHVSECKDVGDNNVERESEVVWGAVYRLSKDETEKVKKHLDHREKDGYEVCFVDVFQNPNDTEPIIQQAMTYVAEPHNPSYAGPMPIHHLAQHILDSHGPSGPNWEYLLELCVAVRKLHHLSNDSHLNQLESAVRQLAHASPDMYDDVVQWFTKNPRP